VTKGDLIQRVTIAGSIVPFRKSVITAPYNGYVKKLFVKIGDHVKAGDPLVSINQSLQSSDGVFPLRAPFNGYVVQEGKEEGEFVKEGDAKDFIVRIDDLSKLFIVANSPEIDRVKVKEGQEGIIKASAVSGKTYKGIIRELSNAAKEREEYSRSQVAEFPIRIEILDPDEQLKSGMSVVVDIVTDKKEKVLMLRHEFIRKENDSYFVIMKDKKRRDIKVGIQNEEVFEILDGLREGDFIEQVDFSELQNAS
jgi:multidrug efflux pump subunit AcrA (membrane-fusion protein)